MLLILGCERPILKMADLKNCYQIMVADDYVFCLEIYDQWGEDNSLKLFNNRLELIDSKRIRVDPLPRISDVRNDTIVLKYTLSSHMNEKDGINKHVTPDSDVYMKLGEYLIIWEYSYETGGEGVGNCYFYDSVFISKNFWLSFYRAGKEIVNKNISQYSFYKGKISYDYLSKGSISSYTLLRSDYLTPTDNGVLDNSFVTIYNSLKEINKNENY